MQNEKVIQPSWDFMVAHIGHLFALGFGSGLSKKAPGTVGTLAALPFWLALNKMPMLVLVLILIAAFIFGVWCCERTSRDLGVHDHGAIVWDEFVGLWVTLAFSTGGVVSMLLGFILFRLFDIVKPWPIRWLDKHVHGGFGIMIDDVLAALFAGVLLWFIQSYMIAL